MIANLHRSYELTAKQQKLPFSLTLQQTSLLVSRNCSICGAMPSLFMIDNGQSVEANYLELKCPQEGYVEDNIITVCYYCSRAKAGLSNEQFFKWIKDVYLTHFKKTTDKTPSELIDSLITVDIKCFMAQENIMNAPEDSEVAIKAAKQAQELNAKRNKLMRSVDHLLGFGEDTPSEKTYG